MSNIKLVVKSADGARKTLTPQEFAQFKLLPGMKVMVLDEATGKAPAKMQVTRTAQDLLLDVAGEAIELTGFYNAPQVDFLPQGEAPNSVSLSSSVPAPAGTGEALVWSSVAAAPVDAPVITGTASTGFGGNWLYAALGGVAMAAAGGGGGKSAAPAVQGTAIDGYLVGAKVFLINGTNKIDTGAVTDANGKFSIQNPNNYTVQIEGGTNSDTGLANTMVLKAPASATGGFVVTPLTTLIQGFIENSPAGTTAAQAQAAVSKALGIPAGVDLLSYDPLSGPQTDLDVKIQKLAVAVASVVMLAETDGGAVVGNIVAGIKSGAFSESAPLDLSDASDLTAVLSNVTTVSAAEVTAVVTAINTATSLSAIGNAQGASAQFTVFTKVVDGVVTVDFGGSTEGEITISVDAHGTATFSRGGITATTKVDNFFAVEKTFNDMDGAVQVSVKINSAAGVGLVINLVDTGAVDHYIIDAPNATNVTFKGDLGNQLGDTVGLKVTDTRPGVQDFIGMTVVTKDLVGAEKLGFYFEKTAENGASATDNDKVTLTSFSTIASDTDVLVVRNGAVNPLLADRPKGMTLDLMSVGYASVADIASAQAYLSASETGTLIIALKDASELPTLLTNLNANPNDLKFIGLEVQLQIGSAAAFSIKDVAEDSQYASIRDAVAGKHLAGLPSLNTAIQTLQTNLAAEVADRIQSGSEMVQSIASVNASLTALTTLVGSNDTCLLYTSPSPRDYAASRMPSSA